MRVAALLLALLASPPAPAAPRAPFPDRAAILRIELRRGPAEGLASFLAPGANPLSRRLAIRALGRIGDRGRAPELLSGLLAAEKTDLALVLRAAGLAGTEKLSEAIAKHLASPDPAVAGAAAEALGRSGGKGAALAVAGLLHHPDPRVRAAALRGLARLAPEALLTRAMRFLDAKEPEVRAAAGFAAARIALRRRDAARSRDPAWDGDPELCARVLSLLRAGGGVDRLAAIRVLGALLPRGTAPEIDLADRPRLLAEWIHRVLLPRRGKEVDGQLAEALDHEDPKVRQLAAETLGKHGTADPLRLRFAKEKDLRLRDILAVELARCGDETAWRSIRDAPGRASMEEIFRLGTRAEVLLATPRKGALFELLAWAAPAKGRALPPAVLAGILWSLSRREAPGLADRLEGLVLGPFAVRDDQVLGSAAGLMVEHHLHALLGKTLERLFPLSGVPRAGPAARRVVAGALGELAKDGKCPADLRRYAERWLRLSMGPEEPSAWVRLAARESASALGMKDVPGAGTLPANDWKGLLRPKGEVLGLDLSGEGEWLTEEEILELADRIAERGPEIGFVTTAGTFRVRLYPKQAPVHCASLVLSAARGLYRNTRWHRVVPAFVIQGGDPQGHGAGDAGFTIPDEVNLLPFTRGALGMPKSRKDDGGCQVFLMLDDAPRLDGRYTLFGRVTAGMDTVDRIRVGDRILDTRLR